MILTITGCFLLFLGGVILGVQFNKKLKPILDGFYDRILQLIKTISGK